MSKKPVLTVAVENDDGMNPDAAVSFEAPEDLSKLNDRLWPSTAETQQFLDAAGRRHVPDDLDLSSVRWALHRYISFIHRKRVSHSKPRKNYERTALRGVKIVRNLRKFLRSSGNGYLDGELWYHLDLDSVHADLARIERVLRTPADQDTNSDGGIDSYAVRLLIPVYEQHFGREAGQSRDPISGKLTGGPFVRFVQAVTRAAGIEVSIHTIEAVLRKHKAVIRKIESSAG